jgi:hypothetical protein
MARRPLRLEVSPDRALEASVQAALLPVSVLPCEWPPEAVPLESAVRASFLRRRWRQLTLAVGIVLLLVSVAVLALNDKGTPGRLPAREPPSDLAEHAALAAALATTQSDLSQAQAALAATKQALMAKQQELAGVRNNLSDVKDSLNTRSRQIERFKSCLSGVSIGLNDGAYGDCSAAVSALQAVDVSCKTAYALF